MTKMTLNPNTLTFSSASRTDLGPVRRFIVLVPYLEVDLFVLTRKVWELASAAGARVQFIGLYSDEAYEPGLKRDLVTMSAMTNSGRVTAEAEAVPGKDWVAAVRSRWQPGDVVVCFEEQRAGPSHRPLSQVLQSDLDIPAYVLPGLHPKTDPNPNWVSQAIAWLGTIAIFIGFFVLQVQVSAFPKPWPILLQMLSIPVEIWLILAWNSLFG